MSDAGQAIALQINGKAVRVEQVPADVSMVDFLREYLNLTGTRMSCGQGICHACTVIVDHADGSSESVRTCITGAHFFNGKKIRTVEGHAQTDPQTQATRLTALQDALLKNYSFQCSYCTPGFVNEATLLLERLKQQPVARSQLEATITDALDGHLCRCTGYVRYYEAVRQVILATPGLVKE
jgi:aerobic-type carbon monoxide dehydrogenase small subunit (CoxS/CutS family)